MWFSTSLKQLSKATVVFILSTVLIMILAFRKDFYVLRQITFSQSVNSSIFKSGPQRSMNQSLNLQCDQNTDKSASSGKFELQQYRHFILNVANTDLSKMAIKMIESVDHGTKIIPVDKYPWKRQFQEAIRQEEASRSYVVSRFPDINYLHFKVQERRNRNRLRTDGGSSLWVELSNIGLWRCPAEDHFNGDYDVYCPLLSGTSKIIMYRHYINFAAYIYRAYEATPYVIYNATVSAGSNEVQEMNGKNPVENNLYLSTIMGWIWVKGELRWFENGKPVDFLSSKEIRTCLDERFEKLYLVGASHMRYMFDYMAKKLDLFQRSWQVKHGNAKMNDIVSYHMTTYGENVAVKIKEFQKKTAKPLNKYHTLVFMTGAWNLKFRGIQSYVNFSAPKLIERLKLLRKDPFWREVRLIWVTSVSTSQANEHHNNYI